MEVDSAARGKFSGLLVNNPEPQLAPLDLDAEPSNGIIARGRHWRPRQSPYPALHNPDSQTQVFSRKKCHSEGAKRPKQLQLLLYSPHKC